LQKCSDEILGINTEFEKLFFKEKFNDSSDDSDGFIQEPQKETEDEELK
jgi:hypothetical protein